MESARRQRWLRPDDDVDSTLPARVAAAPRARLPMQAYSDPDTTREGGSPVRLLRSLLSFDPFGPYFRG